MQADQITYQLCWPPKIYTAPTASFLMELQKHATMRCVIRKFLFLRIKYLGLLVVHYTGGSKENYEKIWIFITLVTTWLKDINPYPANV
jgi:hypothetical protein